MTPQIALEGLVLGYGGRPILSKTVDLEFGRGELWGIVGPNGAGKSTLVKTIVGVVPPVRGRVSAPGVLFGYVPQRGTLDDIFPLSALDVVAMGATLRLGPFGPLPPSARRGARELLQRVGLAGVDRRPFRALSGGQKQRVLIARALAARPDVLILDEPTDGLDLAGELGILELVRTLHREAGLTTLMITHQLNLVVNFVQKLILVHGSADRFETGSPAELLNAERLRAIYGHEVAVIESHGQRLVVAGAVPAAPAGEP